MPQPTDQQFGNDAPNDFDDDALLPRPDDDMTPEQIAAAGETIFEENADFEESNPGLKEWMERKRAENKNT